MLIRMDRPGDAAQDVRRPLRADDWMIVISSESPGIRQ